MRDRIMEALKHSKADYTEIRIEEKEATQVQFRGKELENASTSLDTGGIVRCLIHNKGWGTATFNNLEELGKRVAQAYECAQVARTAAPIHLAPVEPVETFIPATLATDFRDVPLSTKKALAERYNQIMLSADDRIIDTGSVYRDSFSRVILATSQGIYVEEERPSVAVVSLAVARDGDNVQQAYKSLAGPFGFEYVLNQDELPRESAQRAIELLSAKPVQAGKYTVVCDQLLAGVFIHEAFGHLSEADFIYENPKAQEMMVLGRRFGPDFLNVYDDGSLPGLRGTCLYDDEGTPARRNYLIKDGILTGRLHSRETAAKMGEQPSGNARAINYRFPPIVRMTNTAIENGATSFEDMIKDIDLGIYACSAYGGNTMLESFSFSSGHAYMIRNGQLAEMVKDVILAGNLFTTLLNVDAIGNDQQWIKNAGGCGKGNQSPLPVGMGAPHIRIRDVVIGGQ